MRYTVEGADARTGADRVLSVEADTRHEAEAQARAHGILVSEIHESSAQSDTERIEREVAAAMSQPPHRLTAAEELAAMNPARSGHVQLDYAGPRRQNSVHPPDYHGIIRGAALLRRFAAGYALLAILLFVCAATLIALALYALSQTGATPVTVQVLAAGVVIMIGGVALLNRATLIRLSADLAIAQRDIARNSFR
jgi:hypothetical protein